ncbi:MAG: phosphatase [Synechococcaceae cyanobacterium]|nr:phosphatase [Synechococcaceae cyanobacterium]
MTRSTLVPAPLPYSWILTGELAIGPMPRSAGHWTRLQEAGFRSRFSCCYPAESISEPADPADWISRSVALPDHRQQEELSAERLLDALNQAQQLIEQAAPLYLHCFACIERSPLVAVGLAARQRRLPLFDALDWVRRCHPMAMPIYSQLAVLEDVLG